MEVDIALRHFLGFFRLPGEGKMVDRIIEKFGDRYFKDNPNIPYFTSADAPYVLSFSIVMLATDLHSPSTVRCLGRWDTQVAGTESPCGVPTQFRTHTAARSQQAATSNARAQVDKIKIEDWIKNNRLMPELKDFPDSYFHDLYARIKAKRILLRDEKFMEDAMRRDTKQIISKLQNMMKDQTTFFHSAYIGHVKPMFEICWCAMIAAFSVVLEQAEVRPVTRSYLVSCAARVVLRLVNECAYHSLRLRRSARSSCVCRAFAAPSVSPRSSIWRLSATPSCRRSPSSPC